MKYYLIAGEKSGDLHGAHLILALKKLDPQAIFRAWGGEKMQEAGATLDKHYKQTAFMGVWEVLANLHKIRANFKQCKADVLAFAPDVVIHIDYGAFNLRMAKFFKKKGLRTFYYISPKVWAWKQSRAWKVKQYVDQMFVIMHFEKAFYERFDYKVDYVGNPLFDAVSRFVPNPHFIEENKLDPDRPIIALLPGSRKQELLKMLPLMCQMKAYFPDYQFVVAGVASLDPSLYLPAKNAQIPIVFEASYDLLQVAHAALVTSGTATLETALFSVPQVVCYKTSPITYWLVRMVIKVKYISLVNLIADKEVVKELIQQDLNQANLQKQLSRILTQDTRQSMLTTYQQLYEMIRTPGASETAAALMVAYLKDKS